MFASYMTKDCKNLKGTLKVPNKVTTCTGDLYLFYECDGVLKAGCADTNMGCISFVYIIYSIAL